MVEVNTKKELKHALVKHVEDIHVVNEKLCLGLITRPYRFRQVRYLSHFYGYRMIAKQCCGKFDARFVRQGLPLKGQMPDAGCGET